MARWNCWWTRRMERPVLWRKSTWTPSPRRRRQSRRRYVYTSYSSTRILSNVMAVGKTLIKSRTMQGCGIVDPHWSYADPDPPNLVNEDPDPGPNHDKKSPNFSKSQKYFQFSSLNLNLKVWKYNFLYDLESILVPIPARITIDFMVIFDINFCIYERKKSWPFPVNVPIFVFAGIHAQDSLS